MEFYIKNIVNIPITIWDIEIAPKTKIDLLLYKTVDEIKTSLIGGQLYCMLVGKVLTTTEPKEFYNLSLNDEERHFVESCGLVQGFQENNIITRPFKFDQDGNILARLV